MKVMNHARWMVLALLLTFVSATAAHAGVFISVTVAPPMLPVYEQPPCPEPGLMWTPGYWAYDYDEQSYYWVPGAWVPAPYEGALWTPPYWGWNDGMYAFHPGYWGTEVGYYGGVNYGWGYMGIGFIGGRWHERHFEYNEAVMRVDRTYIHETYIDRTVIREHEVEHDGRVAYAGGPGGVRHEPLPEERRAMQMQHIAPTQYQQQHMQQARTERQNFYNVNHGRPQTVALARPLPVQHISPPAVHGGAQMNGNAGFRGNNEPAVNGGARGGMQQQPGQMQHGQQRPLMGGPAQNNNRPQNQNRPAESGMVGVPAQRGGAAVEPSRPVPNPQYRTAPQEPNRPQPMSRPEPQRQYRPAPQPQQRPEPQFRPAPQPQQRPEPQFRPAPQPQQRPEPQYRPAPQPQQRPEPQFRPAPQPQQRPEPQFRPAPQLQQRPEPQFRPAPQPQQRPEPQFRPAPQPQQRPEPQFRPAPQQRPEPQFRPAPQQRAPEPRPDPRERDHR